MSSPSGLAGLCLCKSECLEHWRSFLGPQEVVESKNEDVPAEIQALFGDDLKASTLDTIGEPTINLKSNIFSRLSLDPAFQDENVKIYLNENIIPTLLPAITELLAQRPKSPVMWLADWLMLNNPNQTISPPAAAHDKK